jgi:hypothetical protein
LLLFVVVVIIVIVIVIIVVVLVVIVVMIVVLVLELLFPGALPLSSAGVGGTLVAHMFALHVLIWFEVSVPQNAPSSAYFACKF